VTERRLGDEGQSSVELALVLPVVVLAALLIVQVAAIAHHQLLLVHVAREAVRAAAVSDDDSSDAARHAAQRASGLDRDRLEVQTTVIGDQVRVAVAYRDPTDVVLAGPMLPDLRLTAEATMQREAVP
jgi:Flp pilus assembly protein TadG